ncbi:hypothetical protein [Nocardia shimofusensis]|uniref:hypothetical protein n=1 Tax=Nocardia shimofusensis TaxID=228596 RepID=UPI0008374563|nr:hypothetical protein [Nocardia shimofusensis]
MTDSEAPRPMANLLAAVREGGATVAMNPENFIYIDRDCEYFKGVINRITMIADAVSLQSHWGLGEGNTKMVSGRTLVDRFKGKANGSADGNSVWQIMQDHLRIVEDIQEFHRIARERMMQADSDFAAEFNRLNETLPDRGPAERTPEQALEALGRMPGVLGDLYGSAPSATTPSLWPGVPLPGVGQ